MIYFHDASKCDDARCLTCLFGQEEDGTVICAIDSKPKADDAVCKHWAGD